MHAGLLRPHDSMASSKSATEGMLWGLNRPTCSTFDGDDAGLPPAMLGASGAKAAPSGEGLFTGMWRAMGAYLNGYATVRL